MMQSSEQIQPTSDQNTEMETEEEQVNLASDNQIDNQDQKDDQKDESKTEQDTDTNTPDDEAIYEATVDGGSNKSPRKTPRRTLKSSFNTPISPATPSAKDPKYFLRDKKNVTAYMDIRIDGDKRGRLEIVLFMGIVPKTATNFLKLCTGENKKKLSYKGKKFYKMYVGMALEGGDVENNDGSGKSSIYGGYFDDENFKIRHKQYCLSMKNKDEPNTNASQFYIVVTEDADYLDGQNVVFGYISDTKSQELVNDMEEEGCSLTGKPKCKAVVYKCGKLKK
eukprot:510749_1